MSSNSNTNYTGDDYRILFKMTEEGKSTVEIAKVLKRDLKGIYNIRSKIRKQLSVKASRRIEKVDQKPKPVLKRKKAKASYPPFPKEGSERTIKVKVGALAARDGADVASSTSIDANKLGLVVAEATPEELEQLGLAGAVVVRQVESDSPAAEQDVMTGDVVTMVGSRPIRSVSDFNAAVAELAAGQSVPVRSLRRGAPLFIGLKVPTG